MDIKNVNKKIDVKNSIDWIKEFAKSKGGECLSNEYINSYTPLRWKCKIGHIWDAGYNSVVNQDTWCPDCGRKKHSIEEIREFARLKEGECLSDVYIDSHEYLLWKCKKGHTWEAKYHHVLNSGSWCPICYKNRIDIDYVKKNASEQEVECISEICSGAFDELKWKCKNGHTWISSFNKMSSRKNWCKECKKNEDRRKHLNKCQKIAESKGGMCLSEKYTNSKSHLLWKCEKGHIWRAMPTSILQGNWCPTCNKSGRKRKDL